MPGGTRKAVALTREPGHLLDKFKANAIGLHSRGRWRRSHKSQTYSAHTLVDVGRRLTAVDFV